MKKTIFVALLALINFTLLGCAGGNLSLPPSVVESDFALKEKCSKYLASAQTRAEKMELDENTYQFDIPKIEVELIGVYYSKAKQTCISIFFIYNPNLSSEAQFNYKYFDELTGEYKIPEKEFIDFKADKIIDFEGYVKSFNLVGYERDNALNDLRELQKLTP